MTPSADNPLAAPGLPAHSAVGFGAMDDVHAEFGPLLNRLLAAGDGELPAALRAVTDHCRMHFALEEEWMGTDFPGRECHAQEHAAVLASLDGVMLRLQGGEAQPARTVARALQDWFPPHVQHLDSALAHWLCKQRWGAKPVVLHLRPRADEGHAATAA
ncbi:MAG: hemerythrin domain-containing protein [Pseudomonadota bacterium]